MRKKGKTWKKHLKRAAVLYLLKRRITAKEKKKVRSCVAQGKNARAALALPSFDRVLYRALGGGRIPPAVVKAPAVKAHGAQGAEKVHRSSFLQKAFAAVLKKLLDGPAGRKKK